MARKRLKERRAVVVRLYTIVGVLLLAVLSGLLVYGAWRPEVRIQEVGVSGAETLSPQEVGEHVTKSLEGRHLGIFPKDTIFIFPKASLETSVLRNFPRVDRVEIARSSLTSIDVMIEERIPRILWCGAGTSTPCITGDKKGVLFAGNDTDLLRVEGPLFEEGYTYGNVVFKPGALPGALSLVDAIDARGADVERITFIAPDEVALTFSAGTKLYYVLGEEDGIAETLPPILQSEDLTELEYIDMRFGKRVYIQRRD